MGAGLIRPNEVEFNWALNELLIGYLTNLPKSTY